MTARSELVLDRQRDLVGIYAQLAAGFAFVAALAPDSAAAVGSTVLWLCALASAAVSGGRIEISANRLEHRRWWWAARAVTLHESTTAEFSHAWKGRITVEDGSDRVTLGTRGFPPELWVSHLPEAVAKAPPNRWADTQLRGSLVRVRPGVLVAVVAFSAACSLLVGVRTPWAGACVSLIFAVAVTWLCAWRYQQTETTLASPSRMVAPFVGTRSVPGWAPDWIWAKDSRSKK